MMEESGHKPGSGLSPGQEGVYMFITVIIFQRRCAHALFGCSQTLENKNLLVLIFVSLPCASRESGKLIFA